MNGRSVLERLNQIAETSSRTEKERLVQEGLIDPLFVKVVKYTYDPFITFGLTPPNVSGHGSEELTESSEAWALLDDLAARRVTGGEAADRVKLWLVKKLDHAGSNVLWRVLSKDLRCGITENTVNRVMPGTVPVFTVMLAHKFEEKRIKEWPVAVEPKLDGMRTIALVKDRAGGFFSRTGKPFPALTHLIDPVAEMLHSAHAYLQSGGTSADMSEKLRHLYWNLLGGEGPALALDAEVLAGTFNETGAVRRKDKTSDNAELHVFDVLPYGMLTGDKKELPMRYMHRRMFADFVLGHAPKGAPIKLVPRHFANTVDEIQNYYQGFRDAGLEGAIVKPLNGFYAKKRSHDWLKMKNEETVDVYIIDAFEGTGKYEGQLGGLIVDVDGVHVRVGGGFSDAQRAELWDAFRTDVDIFKGAMPFEAKPEAYKEAGCALLGRMIEVEFHEKTPDGSLRHPRFVRFRDDKDDKLRLAA